MIKQNEYHENLLVFQNSLRPANCLSKYIHRELDLVSFGKLTGFHGSHFVCGGEGGILVVGVCVSIWVC